MNLEALREKPVRYGIGLMSGTSCDGVDAALVAIQGTGARARVEVKAFRTYPYSPRLRRQLLAPRMTARDICELNTFLGTKFADAAEKLAAKAKAHDISADFAASHGHTVAHVPPRGHADGGTLQIGDAAMIAERLKIPVVSDFRPRDVAAGGQGAPLVPYADWLLFARKDKTYATLNIGGIANFTVVTERIEDVVAFDTGPGNMAIDGMARLATYGRISMDKDGALAANGKLIPELLEQLLDHPYFDREPPKSTGWEEFGPEIYLEGFAPPQHGERLEDLVATVTLAVARTIAQAFLRFIQPQHSVSRVIVSGGGVLNETLMTLLVKELPDVPFRKSDHYGLPCKAREAVAFAILGNETLCGTPNNVPAATGARRPVILGKITV
ncbi:MAG TPA: anhydro-N-acetylmuramic acid kinase [Candidatus Hydrogenedentes bacterium]|nr:anhydro-N-acetylmuramic acid kinase [Candidatus Hydrogenedentota bacterium]